MYTADSSLLCLGTHLNKPEHDKTNKMACVPGEDSRLTWPSAQSDQSLLSAVALGSLATPKVSSKDTDQTWRMPRLVCLPRAHR